MKMLLQTLVVALALCAQLTTSLYADQAGEFDWNLENLGRVTTVVYGGAVSRSGTGSSSVVRGTTRAAYVATDDRSNALARIDAKTGAIKWRQVLHSDENIEGIRLTNYGLLSVSHASKNVRLWDAADGTLLWDSIVYSGDKKASYAGIYAIADDRAVVVSSVAAVLVNLKDGNVVWRAEFPLADAELTTQIASDNSAVYLLSGAQLIQVDVKTGDIVDLTKKGVQAGSVLRKTDSSAAVVAVGVSKTSLHFHAVENSAQSKTVSIGDLKLSAQDSEAEFVSVDASIKDAVVILLSSGSRVHLKISNTIEVQVANIISSEGVVVASLTDDASLFHVVPEASGTEVLITSYSLSTEQPTIQWTAEFDVASFGGAVSNAFVGCPARKKDSGAPRCRALLVLRDDGLVMTSNEESGDQESEELLSRNVLWVREESLANIKQVRWITPAETEIEKQPLKHIPSFLEEVTLEANRLKHLVESILSFSSSLFEEKLVKETRARKEPRNSHLFGFSKYIVVLTESGKLFAIRAEASTVAWSVYVGPTYKLYVTRDHPALGSGAELLLVSSEGNLLWLDGDNGEQIESAHAASNGKNWLVMLPKRKHHIDEDTITRHAVAIISQESLEVSLYPKESTEYAHPELDNFYFYRYDEDSKALRGYVIEKSGSDANGVASYQAQQVWQFVLPRDQMLAATSHQKEHTVIDSSVTITGDDSLLLKYLNPNLFGIATVATESLGDDATAGSVPVLYISLLDSVAGRVIHRARHSYATGPIRMIQSENWLVYSFWNSKDKRTEMVSLLLFDGAVGSYNLNLWKRPTWNEFRSSFDPRAPFVLQKSFIYPSKIKSLGVTVTSHGITPQFVLVGMENGQIFKLNRNHINPRQPENAPSPEEQAEGLVQYSPLVPVYNNPHAMVTYNRTVANLKTISTAPAELESTTLVFAYGLDLFYVRIAPAKSFDLLPPDFKHEMLILLCIGFIVATMVTKNLMQRKTLKEAWK